jgi:hypothetical protein
MLFYDCFSNKAIFHFSGSVQARPEVARGFEEPALEQDSKTKYGRFI